MGTSVVRKITFHSAHRLFNEKWNDEKNKAVFGLCANPNYHGHNYDLFFKVTGDIDPETGFVMDLKELSDLLKEEVVEKFDHRNLNLDVQEMKNINPTAENIAKFIYEIMRPKIKPEFKIQVTLYETPRNFVIYPD